MNSKEHAAYWDERIPKGAAQASYDSTDKETFQAFGSGIQAMRDAGLDPRPSLNPVDATFKMAELGIGWGRMLRFMHQQLPQMEVHGFEISPRTVDICQGLDDLKFANLHEADHILEEYEGQFDLIWTCTVLQHIVPQDMFEKACASIVSGLRPGGYVMMFENEVLSGSRHMRGTPKQDYLSRFPGFKWIVHTNHVMRWSEPHFFAVGRKPLG